MPGEHTLPPGARLLHVGPPKTGTTALQKAFHLGREQVLEHGVHYAGEAHRPKRAFQEVFARVDRAAEGRWDALVTEVRDAGDRRVCISNESLATADDDQAAEIVRSLGGDDVHVVMVARPFDALLPSQWQQRVRKRREMVSYDRWLEHVLGDDADNRHHADFWRVHDLAEQVRRWSAAAAPERVTVIVSREGDHGFLPHVFEDLLDLPAGLLVAPRGRSNSSLNLTGAELLRTLDREAVRRGWSSDWYFRDLKYAVSARLRELPRDPAERPILLPPWAVGPVGELNAGRADLLEAADVRVIGEPGSLRPDTRQVRGEERTDEVMVPVSIAAGILGATVDEMLDRDTGAAQRVAELERRLARARRRTQTQGIEDIGGRELARALARRGLARIRPRR